jgi:hypothetical protein
MARRDDIPNISLPKALSILGGSIEFAADRQL